MATTTPMLASDRTVARLLDMKLGEFRMLVEGGFLPRPCKIDEFERWDVEEIRNIISGDAVDGYGDVQW